MNMIYDDYDVTTTAPFESTGSPDCDLFYLDCDSPNLDTLWAALYLDKGMFSKLPILLPVLTVSVRDDIFRPKCFKMLLKWKIVSKFENAKKAVWILNHT